MYLVHADRAPRCTGKHDEGKSRTQPGVGTLPSSRHRHFNIWSCGLRFDVSHSGDMACVGVTLGGSGVDIKAIRYDVEIKAIAQRFFSVSEQRDLASLPVDDQHRAFFNCWTRKEAYVKALESGLLLSLSEFDVSLGALNRPAFWPRVRIRTRRSVGRCSERALGEKDAAAIAAEGAGMKVTCHELISGFGSGDADANS